MAFLTSQPPPPMAAGVWLVTMATAPSSSWFGGLRDEAGGLTPLGQVVASIWNGLAFESRAVALGDFDVLPDRIRALLYVPWEGSARAVSVIIDQFKTLVASTAHRAGLRLDPAVWEEGFARQLIEDPLELAACRSNIKAGRR